MFQPYIVPRIVYRLLQRLVIFLLEACQFSRYEKTFSSQRLTRTRLCLQQQYENRTPCRTQAKNLSIKERQILASYLFNRSADARMRSTA